MSGRLIMILVRVSTKVLLPVQDPVLYLVMFPQFPRGCDGFSTFPFFQPLDILKTINEDFLGIIPASPPCPWLLSPPVLYLPHLGYASFFLVIWGIVCVGFFLGCCCCLTGVAFLFSMSQLEEQDIQMSSSENNG